MTVLIPNTTPIRTFEDHGDRVVAVAVYRDEHIITGSYDGLLRLWDLKTGNMLKKMEGHRSRVRALAVSPNGYWIASGDESGELIAWHGQTGGLYQANEKAHHGWIFSLHFSSDSGQLASGSFDTTTKLWSTSTWQVEHSLSCNGNVHCVRYSPRSNHSLLAIATDHNVQIYQNYRSTSYYGYYDCGYNYTPIQPMITIGRGFTYSLAWMPDGSRLLSGGNRTDPTIREWDTSTWKQVGDPWEGHSKNIHAISLNSSGTLLASASHDGCVRLWRLSSRRTIAIFKHPGEMNCVTFSADDKHIFSGGVDNKISEWPTSEDTLPEDDSKDGLMKEQATHEVSLFSFPAHSSSKRIFYSKAQAHSNFKARSHLLTLISQREHDVRRSLL
jgi:WD40 repeat protein